VLRDVLSRTYRCKLFVAVVENSVKPRRTLVAAMEQIEDWLKKLGMSEYTQHFVENRIDLSVLPELTDQDLEKLGSCSAIAKRCCVRSAISATLRLAQRHPRHPGRPIQLGKTTPSAASSR
jgi:SAM domain (Sterile alpha motif)